MTSVLAAIVRELDAAEHEDLEVRRIRVTPAALRGSVVLVSPGHELPRATDTLVVSMSVDGIPVGQWADRWREVLVHPADFQAMLLEEDPAAGISPTAVFGVPVIRDEARP